MLNALGEEQKGSLYAPTNQPASQHTFAAESLQNKQLEQLMQDVDLVALRGEWKPVEVSDS